MKKILCALTLLIAIILTGCEKAIDFLNQPLLKFGTVIDDSASQPLADVTISISICKGSGLSSCDQPAMVNSDAGGGFSYDERANYLVFSKTGYITTVIDLREPLPPNASFSNGDALVVRMKK